LTRNGSPRRAKCHDWTRQTERLPRQADRCAQFHHGLIEISRTALVQQAAGKFPIELAFYMPVQREMSGKDAFQDALYIAIYHSHRLAKSNAGDRSRGVAANAGQLHQLCR
jgi:hypothetical protein